MDVTANHLLYLQQGTPIIKPPNMSDEYITSQRALMIYAVTSLGGHITSETHREIEVMLDIDKHLAKLSLEAEQERNQSLKFNSFTIQAATERYETINWKSYFEGLLGTVFPEELLKTFIIKLEVFLTNYTKPPAVKHLVNYLIYRVIQPFIKSFASDGKIKKLIARLQGTSGTTQIIRSPMELADATEELKRVAWLIQQTPFAVGRVYIDTVGFPRESRDDMAVMITNILSSFSSSLSGVTWMDDQSILNAYHKVTGIVENLGYPDFQQDDNELDDYYEPLIEAVESIYPESKDAYFRYFKAANEYQFPTMLNLLWESGNRFEFYNSPAVVNAWYTPWYNSITSILHSPMYQYDFPQAVNYGAIGTVIGHELSHGFDDIAVQYDANGTLHNIAQLDDIPRPS